MIPLCGVVKLICSGVQCSAVKCSEVTMYCSAVMSLCSGAKLIYCLV